MLTVPDIYSNAVLDSRFQARVLRLSPSLAIRYEQITRFRRVRGDGCAFVKSGVRLCLADMRELGYQIKDGVIATPQGEQLWPMV